MFIESRRIGPWKSVFTTIGLAVAFPFIFILESLDIITGDEIKKAWAVMTAPVDWKACWVELKDKAQSIFCLTIIFLLLPYVFIFNWIISNILNEGEEEQCLVNGPELRRLIKNPNFIKE